MEFQDAMVRANDKPAFSNGSQFEIWQWNTCRKCVHDEGDCPLIDVAILGKTPAEWTDLGIGDYQCSEFSSKE